MSLNDSRGRSTCPPGEERYRRFYSPCLRGTRVRKSRVQYDYRTPDGKLFSIVAKSLEGARAMRDAWLKEREEAKP